MHDHSRNPRRQQRTQQYHEAAAVPTYGMQDDGNGPNPAAAVGVAARDVPLPPGVEEGLLIDTIARPIGKGAHVFIALLLGLAVGLVVWFALTPAGGGPRYIGPAIIFVIVNLIYWTMHEVAFEFDKDKQLLRHTCKYVSCRRTKLLEIPFKDFGDLEFKKHHSKKKGTSTQVLLDFRKADGNKLMLVGNVERSGYTEDELRLQWSTYLASLAPVAPRASLASLAHGGAPALGVSEQYGEQPPTPSRRGVLFEPTETDDAFGNERPPDVSQDLEDEFDAPQEEALPEEQDAGAQLAHPTQEEV
jgi:hypothetical protein